MMNGEQKENTFVFCSPNTDRILRLGGRPVNPSQSRFWSGSRSLWQVCYNQEVAPSVALSSRG